uniref:Uncharacterized protein n=1 Tax=Rhinolophus ferrumequinum TaxID=59479 RepID=A0A671EWB4_RHIFE
MVATLVAARGVGPAAVRVLAAITPHDSTGTTSTATQLDAGVVLRAESRMTTGSYPNEPPLVLTAASLLKEMCWDSQEAGQVYAVPLRGMMVRQSFATGGSRSSCIYGYVHCYLSGRHDQGRVSAIHCQLLTLAMKWDSSSGEGICLAAIADTGVEQQVLLGDQIPKFTIATLPPPWILGF